jgi:peptidoglycan/xylan/chitin deacetylase (PgdA/CDA1 family)
MPLHLFIILVAIGQSFWVSAPEGQVEVTKNIDSEHWVILTIDDGYRTVYENVYPLLKKYRMKATCALIVDYIAGVKGGYANSGTFLSYSQIREMIDSLDIEIASHSLSHPFLTRLDSLSAWREILYSKTILESLFGVPVITFVYPYGDMNSRVIKLVRRAGYRLARAVRSGDFNLWVDPYRLPGFELRRETSLEAVKQHIRSRRVSILLLHRIVEKPSKFTEWSRENFTALIEWMHQERIQCITLADLYYEWQKELVKKMIQERSYRLSYFQPESLLQKVNIDATGTSSPR